MTIYRKPGQPPQVDTGDITRKDARTLKAKRRRCAVLGCERPVSGRRQILCAWHQTNQNGDNHDAA